jgi:ribonuclease J
MSSKITVFDGARCIGGNKIHLEFDGKGVFFDFGTNYKKIGDFYEEFLSPRSSRGIHDLLFMKMIPNINCYRKDLIPGDLDMSCAQKVKVDAVFLSHAHMDHVGNVGLLDVNIPIVSSQMTAAILKGMMDLGHPQMGSEVAYAVPRKASQDDERIIETEHYKKAPYIGREFLMVGDCINGLKERWCSSPQSRGLEFKEIKPARDNLDFEFKAFEVDHSMYGAAAYAINTPDGWIVYTGDLRLHGKFREKTEKFVSEAKSLDPKVLIIEGTRIGRQDRKESEDEVHSTCLGTTIAEKGLVVADFSPRNFERLDTFMNIAKESGRELVVLAKDAYMLDIMKCSDGMDRMSELLVYRDVKSKRDAFEKMVHDKFVGLLRDPADIAKAPGQYIMCFSFWDLKHLLDIKPAGGTYIYSSSEAYTEEQVIDFVRLWNWMKYFDFRVRGFSISETDGRPVFEKGFHASGHASAAELLKIIEDIDPEIVLPVHTENPEFFVDNLKGYGVVLAQEGKGIEVR